jgi:predicted nucleotidyltransferase
MARFSQMPVGDARPAQTSEAEELIRRAAAWARERPDVRGLALVGSRARGTGGAESDIDLVLLTRDARSYLEDDVGSRA